MPESSGTPIYKVILKIIPASKEAEPVNLFETVLSCIADYLERRFSLRLNRSIFCSGQPYSIANSSTKLHTAIIKTESRTFERFHWAASIHFRDPINPRLNWTYHIGVEQAKPTELILCATENYFYYCAGSFSCSKSPQPALLPLIKDLLNAPAISCVSGAHRLTDAPWDISPEDVQDFLALLNNPKRTVPLVVVACQDPVDPHLICSRTIGNLIVCCVKDLNTYAALCGVLPPEHQFQWGSIKVFLPIAIKNAFHPPISYQQITALGAEGVAGIIYQAFCTCMTAAERKIFVSLETIQESLAIRNLSDLKLQNATLDRECNLLRKQNEELQSSQRELSDQLDFFKTKLEQSDTPTYELLLTDAIKDNDRLKKCLSLLTNRLYANPKEPLTTEGLEDCAEVCELALALRTFQALSFNPR